MKSKKGRHKSVEKDLRPSVNWLQSLDYVERVILGITEGCRHAYAPGTLRYQMDAQGGIKIKGYGGSTIVNIFVKISEERKPDLIQKINERWS